jgi:hypothetical protein
MTFEEGISSSPQVFLFFIPTIQTPLLLFTILPSLPQAQETVPNMPTPYTSMMSSATKPGFEEKIHEDSGRNSDEISSTDTLLQPSLAPKRRSSYSPRNLFHYFALFLLGIFGFTALFVIIFRQQVAASIVELSARIAQCPTINATETVFAEHYEYQTWDDSSDVLWDHLLPPNGGFLADEKDPDALPNGVAMFHQLHCVGMFRNDFKELYARLAGRSDGGKNALYQIDEQHLLHW